MLVRTSLRNDCRTETGKLNSGQERRVKNIAVFDGSIQNPGCQKYVYFCLSLQYSQIIIKIKKKSYTKQNEKRRKLIEGLKNNCKTRRAGPDLKFSCRVGTGEREILLKIGLYGTSKDRD